MKLCFRSLCFSGIVTFALYGSCNPDSNNNAVIAVEYKQFTFVAHDLGRPNFDRVNEKLEHECARILQHHGLKEIHRLTFHVFSNTQTLHDEFKKKYPAIFVPDFATGLAPSPSEIYLVLPSSDQYTSYIHELTHCVSQNVNPTIPNNPRWVWESIALFEASELNDPRNIPGFLTSEIKSLSELNTFDNSLVYQVGFLLGEYILINFGAEKYAQLIKENGNITKVLGLTEKEFIDRWYQYLKLTYNF